MPLGVNVTTNEISPATGVPTNTGTAFFVGLADQGPSTPVQIQSLAAYVKVYGQRSATSAILYDSIQTFFQEGGASCYISRVTDATAATASLVLRDAGANPTVSVTAQTPGVAGNATNVVVTTANGPTFTGTTTGSGGGTFTGNTTSASTTISNVSSFTNIAVGAGITGTGIPTSTTIVSVNVAGSSIVISNAATATGTGVTFTTTIAASATLTAVSSFAGIGVGTPISGTGIPAGTTIVSVNPTASTAVMSNPATSSGANTVITPSNFTLLVEDAFSNVLETHGPYVNSAALIADTTSSFVNFAQATGTGNTTNNPAPLTLTPLAGGANSTTITATSYVNTLANFAPTLGPGQVLAPGQTTAFVWNGLLNHAVANNRVALLDLADSANASALVGAIGSIGNQGNASYGAFFAPTCIIPGLVAGTTRTVPASAVIAGLCQRVDGSGNPNQAAAGRSYPLNYVVGFNQTYNVNDTLTLNNAGINTFQIRYGVLENYGFSTPVPQSVDAIYWQFSHSRLRMALVADAQAAGEPFVFAQIDGQGRQIAAFGAAIGAVLGRYYSVGALYGLTPNAAYSVNVGPTINTPTTLNAGQLNANCLVVMSPFAQAVNIVLSSVAVGSGR